jgi:hypothetical protein
MTSLLELFCDVDDFCKEFKPELDKKMLMSGSKCRNRVGKIRVNDHFVIFFA